MNARAARAQRRRQGNDAQVPTVKHMKAAIGRRKKKAIKGIHKKYGKPSRLKKAQLYQYYRQL